MALKTSYFRMPVGGIHRHVQLINGYPVETVTFPSGSALGVYHVHRKKVSDSIPGFFRSKRKGKWLPPHTYSHVGTVLRSTPYVDNYEEYDRDHVLSYLWNTTTNTCGFIWGKPFDEDYIVPSAYTKAFNRFREAADADMSVNVAQMYAERVQTAKTITGTVERITGLIAATALGHRGAIKTLIKKPNPGLIAQLYAEVNSALKVQHKRIDMQKRLSSDWLSYKYGWKPLCDDITGSIRALTRRPIDSLVVRASGTGSITGRRIASIHADDRILSESRYKMTGALRIDDPALYTASTLGLTNPLLLAHELTWMSFVVDWVFPLGRYLENLTAFQGMSVVGSIQHQHKNHIIYERVEGYGASGTFPSGGSWIATRGGRMTYEVHGYRRWYSGELPTPPGLFAKSPINPSNILDRIGTSMALVTSLLPSKRR